MSKGILFLLYTFTISISVLGQKNDFLTKFELTNQKETVTYEEGIAYYQMLADKFPEIKMQEMGITDSGKPLHLVLYSYDKEFDIQKNRSKRKAIFLINNAIHPGESDGVDASMMFLRDVALGKTLKKERKGTVFAIIPFYNIGGVLNRNSHTRVNQNGPVAYGFRGNARNYDLNRDFIKGDTRNAWAFWEIFNQLNPDFFLDTHVSNGADYQYAITLIATQKDKLSDHLSPLFEKEIKPFLYQQMEAYEEPMTPFVNVYGRKPDNGFNEFADWPRYSSGYAALFNTYSFMSETHMLKPYDRRVNATYQLIIAMGKSLASNKKEILESRRVADLEVMKQAEFPIKWELDAKDSTLISFKGYEGRYIESKITKQKRLYYDKSQPFERKIVYKNTYKPSLVIKKPSYYVIPQGWHSVLKRLKQNGVTMSTLKSDSTIDISKYLIKDYQTVKSPYEGHYFHYNVTMDIQNEKITFRQGDYLIPVNQVKNRYIVESLEPQAEDSFFKWNFFDMILASKESFSSYVFEELAEKVLLENPVLMREFELKKQEDEFFSKSRYVQLNWIYERSSYREKEFLRYPIFRIE